MHQGSWWYRSLLAFAMLALASCAEQGGGGKPPVQQAVPGYKVGKPYAIDGVWYYPAVDYNYAETGIASWYGPNFHGLATANGETYDMNALSAAHRTLPMPSMVRVTNLDNGRQIALRINDRGPFVNNRIIDVSRRAAQLLGFEQQGTARVRVEIMETESRQLAMLAGAVQPAAEQTAAGGQADAVAAPKVTAAPAGVVTEEALAPPPGSAAAPPKQLPPAPQPPPQPAVAVATVTVPVTQAGPQPDGRVTVVPVRKTAMFIQAGAFTNLTNATRLRTQLTSFGHAQVVPAYVGTQKYFRVRLGPIGTLAEADSMLAKVVASGHPEARLIVD
ncbi:MAG TPA: septal ring lytic transglycosylase RlpA family protein [Candidatus Acidoferrum sp.]|nr:septal ring lytic transglycosylase RlpA family protein [Candidatus Acidoferrum sp.]